jgi:hypothetical protein
VEPEVRVIGLANGLVKDGEIRRYGNFVVYPIQIGGFDPGIFKEFLRINSSAAGVVQNTVYKGK